MNTQKKTIADFKEGIKVPCGLDQTKVVDGKRVYPKTSEYKDLTELGITGANKIQIPQREDTL